MMVFNLGLIGSGNIARAHVAAAAALGDEVRIRAVVDPRTEVAQSLAEPLGAAVFPHIRAMLTNLTLVADLDGVVVCTPPSARAEVVEAALGAGLSVLMEKPLAHSMAEGQRLADLSRAYPDQACLVGFCHRFTPAIDTMIQLVNDGRIGPVVRFENTFAANLPHLREAWMSDPAVSGGGSLIDTGMHSLDLFRYLFGHAAVEGAVLRHGWDGRGESNATLLLSAPADRGPQAGRIATPLPVAGHIACGWAEASRFDVRLVGTLGSMTYDFEDAQVLRLTYADGRHEVLTVPTHESRFARQMRAFIDTARGAADLPVCDFHEGLESLALVFDAAQLDHDRQKRQVARTLRPTAAQGTPALSEA